MFLCWSGELSCRSDDCDAAVVPPAAWTQQRNIFLPATRPPCLEELHHQARDNLSSLQRDHQQRRSQTRERRVTICVSVAPPAGDHPSPHSGTLGRRHRAQSVSTAVRCDPDSDPALLGQRSKFPVPNVPSTLDRQTNWRAEEILPTSLPSLPPPIRDSDIHQSPNTTTTTCSEGLSFRLSTTRDSGCQTDDFPNSSSAAAARRRLYRAAHRGPGTSYALSVSAGNISSLPDDRFRDDHGYMFAASAADSGLRSRSLPRDASRLTGHRSHSVSDGDEEEEEEEEEELSPFDTEDFLSGGGGGGALDLKDEEEEDEGEGGSQAVPERQRGSLGYQQRDSSPEHGWLDHRGGSSRSSKAHMGSCEMSSSSDTFSSPMHSCSAAGGVLGVGPMDHKDDLHQMDHQSSSGNWSGSSSTCPSHTSETLPPAASPQLTGSSHCDSELSLNAVSHHAMDEVLDHHHYPPDDGRFPGLRTQRAGSFSSTAMDILEDAALMGACGSSEGEWGYGHGAGEPPPLRPQSFSPEPSREQLEGSLGCPSFTSMATCESSFSDKPPSEKADTVSHYSVDTEGYYTSMHFDCGLNESQSFPYGSECGTPDYGSHAAHNRRCLSLKKSRAKPSPPKRSSSLRQICSEGNLADHQIEPKISSDGQQRPLSSSKERRLNLDLGGSETPSLVVDPPEAWGLEDCEGLEDAASYTSTDTQSFKDDGAVQSDYADLWLLNDLKPNDTYRSLSNSSTATGTTVVECVKSQESSGSQTSQSDQSRATTPSLPPAEGSEFKLPSPDAALAGLGSPSSGYSSQSETPTSSSFPLPAFFPSPLSPRPPSSKRKPKVPERKSSLSSAIQLRCSRDGGSSSSPSKTALELPTIPPSNLDLSGLQHKPSSSVLALRSQMQLLKQSNSNNKQKPPGSGRSSILSCKSEVPPMRLMSITPTVLHSIQLKSFSQGLEKPSSGKSLIPTPLDLLSTLSGGKSSSEISGHPIYASFVPSSFQASEFCEPLPPPPPPLFTSKEPRPGGVAAEEACPPSDVIDSQDGHAAVETGSPTAFLDQSPPEQWDGEADSFTIQPSAYPKAETMSQGGSTAKLVCPGLPEETPSPPEPEPDLADEDEPPYLRMTAPGFSSWSPDSQTAFSRYEEVPVKSCPSESSQLDGGGVAEAVEDQEESFGSSWSSSQDSREEASPEAEDASSKGKRRGEDGGRQRLPVSLQNTTTEDLFAMIHRDSAELGVRNRLGGASGASSPVPMSTPPGTPTPPAQTPPASPATPCTAGAPQKAPSPIYRSVKKSNTSSEDFKLLLLRKGSRSDCSYRMSASEILRSPTPAPAAPRTPGDPPGAGTDDEHLLPPHLSPLRQQQLPGPLAPGGPEAALSPLPRANAEGFSPKASPHLHQSCPSPSGARQGRPRAPPPATSSRYAARCRFFAAPMQAISEGEGESSDGSPHDERPSSGCS
ncbi:hypothetical protein CRUP_006839 [Coryphaenoides rupestris]|nr:hypothetical protein CRUP_006839 [Coryphaenoides rupestris]